MRDLSVSTPWYRALFGSDPALDEDTDAGFHHVVWALGNGTLFGIHQHDARTRREVQRVPGRPGPRRVRLRVRAELEKWATARRTGHGHGGIVDAHYGSGLSFRDPDGIALEFFAPPA